MNLAVLLRRRLRRVFVAAEQPEPTAVRGRFPGLRRVVLAAVVALLASQVLAFWWNSGARLDAAATPATWLDHVSFEIFPGGRRVLGRDDLGQRAGVDAADVAHLGFSAGPDGSVSLFDASRERRVGLRYVDDHEMPAGRWQLEVEDLVHLGPALLEVTAIDGAAITLAIRDHAGDRTVTIAAGGEPGGRARLDGRPMRVCSAPSALDRIVAVVAATFENLLPDRSARRVATLGGRLDCIVAGVASVALTDVPWQAVAILHGPDGFELAAGEERAHAATLVEVARTGRPPVRLADLAHPLVDPRHGALTAVVVGRTTYTVAVAAPPSGGRRVTLTPIKKIHRFAVAPNFCSVGRECLCAPTPAGVPLAAASEGVQRCFRPATRAVGSGPGATGALGLLSAGERAVRIAMLAGPPGLRLVLLLAGLLAVARGHHSAGRPSVLAWAFLATAATAAVAAAPELAAAGGTAVDVGGVFAITVAAFAAVTVAVVLDDRLGPAGGALWLAVLLLSAFGSSTLSSLALDGETTHWADHAAKHLLLFLGPLAVACAGAVTASAREIRVVLGTLVLGTDLKASLARMLPLAAVLLVFGLWFLSGNEEGVGGFQPVEFGKLTVVVVGALVAVGLGRATDPVNRRTYRRWLLSTAALAVLLVLALVLVPALESDYSPLLIVLAVSVALLLLFFLPWLGDYGARALRRFVACEDAPVRFVRRPRGLPAGKEVAGVVCLAVAGICALVVAFPALSAFALTGRWDWPDDPTVAIERLDDAARGWRRVPAQRVISWLDLDASRAGEAPVVRHRDLGLQLLASREAVASAPCDGDRLDLGDGPLRLPVAAAADAILRASGAGACVRADDPDAAPPASAGIARIPVIQNDFIATYVTARLGLRSALALVLAQAMLLGSAAAVAVAVRGRPGYGEPDRAVRKALSILAAGIAVLFLLHWAIAWSNMLGLLPVMGQPMSWIAAATSHHLFMVLPATVLLLVAARHAGRRPLVSTVGPPPWRRSGG